MFRNWMAAVLCCAVCVGVAFAREDLSQCTVDAKTDLAGLTQAALAEEWADPIRLPHILDALRLLTLPGEKRNFLDFDSKQALQKLQEGGRAAGPNQTTPPDGDLYQAASTLPDFLDWVATANKLVRDKPKPGCLDHLMDAAKPLIGGIFMRHDTDPSKSGPQTIKDINDLFTQKNNYVALYLLLSSYPKDTQHLDDYARDLGILRAAFAADPDRLAKLVSDKISAPE